MELCGNASGARDLAGVVAPGHLRGLEARHIDRVGRARGLWLTGDEPHYLVMADSLLNDRTVELSAAYWREFENLTFTPSGSMQSKAILDPRWGRRQHTW